MCSNLGDWRECPCRSSTVIELPRVWLAHLPGNFCTPRGIVSGTHLHLLQAVRSQGQSSRQIHQNGTRYPAVRVRFRQEARAGGVQRFLNLVTGTTGLGPCAPTSSGTRTGQCKVRKGWQSSWALPMQKTAMERNEIRNSAEECLSVAFSNAPTWKSMTGERHSASGRGT